MSNPMAEHSQPECDVNSSDETFASLTSKPNIPSSYLSKLEAQWKSAQSENRQSQRQKEKPKQLLLPVNESKQYKYFKPSGPIVSTNKTKPESNIVLVLDYQNMDSFIGKRGFLDHPLILDKRVWLCIFYVPSNHGKIAKYFYISEKCNVLFILEENTKEKNAVDMLMVRCMCYFHTILPKEVTFRVISGDNSFLSLLDNFAYMGRHITVISPHPRLDYTHESVLERIFEEASCSAPMAIKPSQLNSDIKKAIEGDCKCINFICQKELYDNKNLEGEVSLQFGSTVKISDDLRDNCQIIHEIKSDVAEFELFYTVGILHYSLPSNVLFKFNTSGGLIEKIKSFFKDVKSSPSINEIKWSNINFNDMMRTWQIERSTAKKEQLAQLNFHIMKERGAGDHGDKRLVGQENQLVQIHNPCSTRYPGSTNGVDMRNESKYEVGQREGNQNNIARQKQVLEKGKKWDPIPQNRRRGADHSQNWRKKEKSSERNLEKTRNFNGEKSSTVRSKGRSDSLENKGLGADSKDWRATLKSYKS